MSDKHFDINPERYWGDIEPNNRRDKVRMDWVSLFDRYGRLREEIEWRVIDYQGKRNGIEDLIYLYVEEAMKVLDEREKQILRYYYWDGLTLQEIGDIFFISFQRVKKIIDRALEKMREYLAVEVKDILYNGGKYSYADKNRKNSPQRQNI